MFADRKENSRGSYDILARYNEKGLFRIVETMPTIDLATLAVEQLERDDILRHRMLRETKDWDFVQNDVKKKKYRAPREPKQPPVNFSFED